MDDELQQLALMVYSMSQAQEKDHRRIENLEQAFLIVKDILLRQDRLNDDWRAWRQEAEEHRRNTDAHISVIGKLLMESAQRTAENSKAIAENNKAIAENSKAIAELRQTVREIGERVDKLTAAVELSHNRAE